MNETMAVARRLVFIAAATIGFAGAWLWFAPFHGPPGSLESNKTVRIEATGDRGLCGPTVWAYLGASTFDPDTTACQDVGTGRFDTGLLLFATAAFAAAAGHRAFRGPGGEPDDRPRTYTPSVDWGPLDGGGDPADDAGEPTARTP